MRNQIIELLNNYKNKFGGSVLEDEKIRRFFEYLNGNENVTDRKNMNGHVTVSSFVVEDGKTLLLWHKAMNRFQQPGGHIDPGEMDIFSVAIRELKEETGLGGVLASGEFANCPINIDIFEVKENPKKQEGSHFHFDLFILLELKGKNQEIKNEDDGTTDAKWVGLDNLNLNDNPYVFETVQKYKRLSSVLLESNRVLFT